MDPLLSHGSFTLPLWLALPHLYCSGMPEDLRAPWSAYLVILVPRLSGLSTQHADVTPVHLHSYVSKHLNCDLISTTPGSQPASYPQAFLPGLVKVTPISGNSNIVLPLVQVTTQKVSLTPYPPTPIQSFLQRMTAFNNLCCRLLPDPRQHHSASGLGP